ncbi:unnamed protein product [Phytophthora fragariaefolia]|uniref:Unnamed protein product n=1 Tax=Phytophthora fragariaefolia TaxID=1490495 RepID=A0A9W6Y499_9STRA|nr:unnamed protein product [Phytophthora fragariaefolia]
MGLSDSPGTFNRLLQKVFKDLEDVMMIYFDDIYVFTQSEDVADHVEALDRVLSGVKNNNFKSSCRSASSAWMRFRA